METLLPAGAFSSVFSENGSPSLVVAPRARGNSIGQFARIVSDRPVETFLRKLFISKPDTEMLIIVSPFIGSLAGTRFALRDVCGRLSRTNTPIYVLTREPVDDYHREGVAALLEYDNVEVRYNPALHAKLYVSCARDPSNAFALFGSGNLTYSGAGRNIELGMMVFGRGPGRDLINRLSKWGLELRTLSGTTVAKPRKLARRQ